MNNIYDTLADWYDDHQASSILNLIKDSTHDKHIVFTIGSGFVKFRDSLGRTGSRPVFTTIDKAIDDTKASLRIDESWTFEVID